MYRTLMVPLDGSPLAERALPYAAALARVSGAKVYLVRAAMAHPALGSDAAEEEVVTVEAAENYLNDVAGRLPREQVETAVFYGSPQEAIVEEISLRKVDLVVMATHGRSGLNRLLQGSVAAGVLARSPVPILLVRAWQEEHDVTPLTAAPRLLVPLDGSPFAEAALPVAREMAATLGGTIELVQAVEVPHRVPSDTQEQTVRYLDQEVDGLKHDAMRYLHGVAERLKDGEASAPPVHVGVGDPVEVISATGRDVGAAMIVMATHGRTGLARLLLGSVADGVLRQERLPLLLVRPEGGPQRG